MRKLILASALLAAFGAASAHETTYNITTTWFEPQTQPNNTIFEGSFVYDEHTFEITGLQGRLSESMTGGDMAMAMGMDMGGGGMNWLPLTHQLVSWHDATLGGTFAAVFKNDNTKTFWTGMNGDGDGWSPSAGIDAGGIYYGFPIKAANPGNAYALIFVPNDPTAALTQAQIDKLAYADCAPGGMMGAVCMTGTSESGYGAVGTMDGYPLSQSITVAAVPEPETNALLLAGLGVMGAVVRRRRQRHC